ncbi:AprI/Inh family metalloprotease inhibitor [Pseudomonas syringae]|uniref:AprI/Inh family metalloprotease inhibitor n=1 Tax=Pseudomonas syringae CC1417 TaxID=1357272 RepID=A0AAU8LHP2_PSESX
MSLKLPSPAELSGTWRLFASTQEQDFCELSLNADEPASVGNPDCATRWLKETPTGWVPTPDGLALIGKDGTGLIHFNRLSERLYQARLPGGEQLNLERVAD